MKKFFALIVSFGLLTTVFAQSRGRSNSQTDHHPKMEQSGNYSPSYNQVYNGGDRGLANNRGQGSYSNQQGRYNSYSPDFRERDRQLQQINQDCDARMKQINNGYFRNGSGRANQMRSIENERTARMREVNDRYAHSQNGGYNEHSHNYGRS